MRKVSPGSAASCSSCCARSPWLPWANADLTIFGTSRRRRHNATRSAHSWQLRKQIAKPVFLHQRDAHDDFLAILTDFPGLAGVAHCFTAGGDELERYLALGLYIGITGWVCDERRGLALRHVVPRIPSERLLLETDAPYLLPRDLSAKPKSRRNEPAFLPHIAAVVAALRGESIETVAAASTRNAVNLFGL